MMTPSHRTRARLIGLPGSLRRGSYSRAVLQVFARSLAGSAELTIRDIRLPLYNEDEDGEFASSEVDSFRAAIAGSDGLVIVTPEYNHGIPGVLKNALDWASSPHGTCSLTDKPVVVMSVSPPFTGGVRAATDRHRQVRRRGHARLRPAGDPVHAAARTSGTDHRGRGR